uniref:NADH-ubiquinone oxidoreductase chain 4L n=1 Tax=Valvata hokkaidoensis TaxID=96458 RepID=A0A7R7T1S2_9GAST|nr:ND4L [Valvata hokkaidoensis]
MVMIFISSMGIMFSIVSFLMQRYHFLNILLSLEVATMNLFILIFSQSMNLMGMSYNSLIYITLGACEASLGLAILVSLLRVRGNDYVWSFSSMKC